MYTHDLNTHVQLLISEGLMASSKYHLYIYNYISVISHKSYNTNVVVAVHEKNKAQKNYDFKLLSDENVHEKEREGMSFS